MNLYGITLEELETYFLEHDSKKFKATQVYEWLYKKRIHTLDEMRNVKKETIALLKKDFVLEPLKLVLKQTSKDVCKFLFELSDKSHIEAVLMFHDYGNSLCISSQVGCNMGCIFCESGRLKKVRNLTVDEMVLQVLQIEEIMKLRITHVVLMGIGEPFDNYENVMRFINILNHPKGIDLGSRHITISTCGIISKIKEFINYPKQVNLALSLHAANDQKRSQLMPINKANPLKELMPVLKDYIKKTNRRLTFEYILLSGINDQKEDALQLATLLQGMNCYVNLIPYNETSHFGFKKSSLKTQMEFYDILKKNKINVTIRKEFGSQVNAACGQLRANYEEDL